MELSKKQLEFWTVMLGVILGVSILVMLIDFSIKAAILEESAKLRGVIDGQKPARANDNGAGRDSRKYAPVSAHVLGEQSPGMETGNVANGTSDTVPSASE